MPSQPEAANRTARAGLHPAVTLLIVSPVVGELLSSSAPPAVFFIPGVFVLFVCLYGAGALLIRELAVRWNRGWPSILLLGAAYGILEEGLAAKSFFDPHWRSLGLLGEHGRAWGVNWIWALDLTLFHAVYSIALPILMVHLLYPGQRAHRWTSNRFLAGVGAVFALDLALFFQKANAYAAPLLHYVAATGVAVLLVVAARKWPQEPQPLLPPTAVSRWLFGLLGFAATAGLFLLIYGLPLLRFPAWVSLLFTLGTGGMVAGLLLKWTGNGRRWSTEQQFALVSGTLGFWALMAPLQEFNPTRSDRATGMTLVGIAAFILLFAAGRRIHRFARYELRGAVN